jgi:hypothetical protein
VKQADYIIVLFEINRQMYLYVDGPRLVWAPVNTVKAMEFVE